MNKLQYEIKEGKPVLKENKLYPAQTKCNRCGSETYYTPKSPHFIGCDGTLEWIQGLKEEDKRKGGGLQDTQKV